MTNYETASEIELAIVRHFGLRQNVIVPNVSWGMFGYELDLCILNCRSLYATEVEIKTSVSDLRKDSKKCHKHDKNRNLIKYLWFAMPEKLSRYQEFVQENAGIILVGTNGLTRICRVSKANPLAQKWTYENAYRLGRLGTMRMWNLKQNLLYEKLNAEKK